MVEALSIGAVHRGTLDLAEAATADVVVVATPVNAIVDTIRRLAVYLRPGMVVTDVGSTKSVICKAASEVLPPDVTFIGGHPMAGSERQGVSHSDPYLFQNAVYALTPPITRDSVGRVREESVDDNPGMQCLLSLVRAIGAIPLVIKPEEHDWIVAAVSHLPHMVAVSLVQAVAEEARINNKMLELAAGGFRDTTRVASGAADVWTDICLTNGPAIVRMLERFEEHLSRLKELIARADSSGLIKEFEGARQIRATIPSRSKGILSSVYDMVVQLEDRPGALHELTGILARAGINILDLEILRVREGEGGTIRLAFERPEWLDQALVLLNRHGYVARRR